jgi:flagellar motor protein MotB
MPPAKSTTETSRADWLPWFLAIFGAGCAAFVLLKGVLPARAVNEHLMQRVARLETAAQTASSERATLEQAKGHLLEQYTSVQAQISSTGKDVERTRQAQEQARKDMGSTFSEQMSAGDFWFEQRSERELVIGIRDRLLFNGDRAEVSWKGRQFLKAVAENLKHLPADQVYEIGGHFEPASGKARVSEAKARSSWDISAKRAASVARYLQDDGGLSGSQLIAAGFSNTHPNSDASKNRRVEIVLRPL